MKKLLLIALVGILLGVGGYYLLTKNGSLGTAVNTTGPIKIGAAFGLSGECASWGDGELKATQLAIEQKNKEGGINGRPVELVVEDIQCSPSGAVNAITKLITADHVSALLGPSWGDSFQAGFGIAHKYKVPAIGASCILGALVYNQTPTDYAFSTYFPAKSEMAFLSTYAKKRGVKNIYVVHDNDPFGLVMADEFKQSAAENKLAIIGETKLAIGQFDFRTVIATIEESKADAVLLSFQAPSGQAKFLKQAKELKLKTLVLSPSDIEDVSLLNDFGAAMEGVLYARPIVSGASEQFYKDFKERFGIESQSPADANAYDAARIMLYALQKNAETGADITETIKNIEIPGTVVETLRFDNTHQLYGSEYVMKTIRDGKFVILGQ